MNATITVLQPGDRFTYRDLIYTVETTELAADRHTLTAHRNHRRLENADGSTAQFRWRVGFVAHLLDSGKASRIVVTRCDLCGEPDDSDMAEIVSGARHLIVHEGCAVAHADKRGVPLASILA